MGYFSYLVSANDLSKPVTEPPKRGQIYFQAVVKPLKERNTSSTDETLLALHKRFPS